MTNKIIRWHLPTRQSCYFISLGVLYVPCGSLGSSHLRANWPYSLRQRRAASASFNGLQYRHFRVNLLIFIYVLQHSFSAIQLINIKLNHDKSLLYNPVSILRLSMFAGYLQILSMQIEPAAQIKSTGSMQPGYLCRAQLCRALCKLIVPKTLLNC